MKKLNSFKLLILCLILLVQSLPLVCQEYKINWGPVYEKEGGLFAMFRLLGFEKDLYYIHSQAHDTDILLSYNNQHKLIDNIDVKKSLKNDEISFRDLIETRTGTHAYIFDDDKDYTRWKIYTAGFADGKFTNVKEVLNKEYSRKLDYVSLYAQNNAHTGLAAFNIRQLKTIPEYAVSKDKSHVAIFTRFNTSGKDNKFMIAIAVFDENLQLLWNKTEQFDYFDSETHLNQFSVSNDGKVYLLIETKERDGDAENPNERKVSLVRLDQATKQNIPLIFDGDNRPDDIRLFIPEHTQGDFTMAGFYKAKGKRLEGFFISKGEINTTSMKPVLYKFSDTLLLKLMPEKAVEKDKGLQSTFNLDQLVNFDDGKFAFIAEKRYRTTETSSTRTYTVDHSDEIIMPLFSATGDLLSVPVIEKSYSSRAKGTDSYSFATNGTEVYFIYNDFKIRKERKELKEEGMKAHIYSDITIIDNTGKITKQKTLFTDKDYELYFCPILSTFNENKFLIGTMNPNKYSFGLIPME